MKVRRCTLVFKIRMYLQCIPIPRHVTLGTDDSIQFLVRSKQILEAFNQSNQSEIVPLNKTISCINQLYLRNINMMNKLQEFTTQAKKHMSKKTKGESEPVKTNLGPSSHASEQSNGT